MDIRELINNPGKLDKVVQFRLSKEEAQRLDNLISEIKEMFPGISLNRSQVIRAAVLYFLEKAEPQLKELSFAVMHAQTELSRL